MQFFSTVVLKQLGRKGCLNICWKDDIFECFNFFLKQSSSFQIGLTPDLTRTKTSAEEQTPVYITSIMCLALFPL